MARCCAVQNHDCRSPTHPLSCLLAHPHAPPPTNTLKQQGPGDPYYVSLGIVTLEDVIEYILGDEIQDETDTAAVPAVSSKAHRGLDGSRHGGLDASGHGGSNHAYLRYQRAVSDFGRLRLLDRTLRDEKLDAGEARVGEKQELVLCG